MCNRTWIRNFGLLALLLALGISTVAWDGITPPPVSVNASGLALGPILTGLAGRAMWIDGAGRALVLDMLALVNGGQVQTTQPPRCWQFGAKAVDLGPMIKPAALPLDGGAWRIAARPGRDDVIVLEFQRLEGNPNPFKLGSVVIYQASCGAPAKEIATVAAPPGFPQGKDIALEQLPLTADGVVYFVLRDLIRIDTKLAVPKWEVAATENDLRTLIGAPATQKVAFRAIGLTADDRLWVAFETLQPKGPTAMGGGLLEVGKDGKLKLLHALDPNLTGFAQMLHSKQLNAMLIGLPKVVVQPVGKFQALAVLDESAPFKFSGQAPPWPVAAPLDDRNGFISGFDGSIYVRFPAVTTEIPANWLVTGSLQPLAVVPTLADFDRDGVSAAREATLGTSDLQYDSDGDGYNDGVEAGLLGSNPADAASHPPAAAPLPDVTYGLSMLIGEKPPFPVAVPDKEGPFQCDIGGIVGGVCPAWKKGDPVFPMTCIDPAGKTTCLKAAPGSIAAISADGKYAFSFAVDSTTSGASPKRVGIDRIELRTGEIIHLYTNDFSAYDPSILPVSDTDVLMTRKFAEVTRFSATGAKVVLWSSDGCPVAAGGGLGPCVAEKGPEESMPLMGGSMRTVGYHPGTASWIFTYPRGILGSYIAVSKDKVAFVANHFEMADGLEIERLFTIPSGGFAAMAMRNTSTTGNGAFWNGTFVLPDLFGPGVAGKPPQAHFIGDLGPWFFRGLYGVQKMGYKQERTPAGCLAKVKCEFSFASPVIDVLHEFKAQWVPVAPALEKGEIIFATEQRYRVAGSTADGAYGKAGQVWLLGRVSRLGAAVEWLDLDGFTKLLVEGAAKNALAATPLAQVTALGVSPDGGRLCIAEGGRVWELSLSAGKATSVALADAGPGLVGCTYDEAGNLARLVSSPAAIRVGNQTLVGDPKFPAVGLARVAGQWLIRGKGEKPAQTIIAPEAYCLDAKGKITPTGLAITGLAEVPTGIAILDAAGNAWTGRDPCAGDGKFPEEQLATEVRYKLNEKFSPRPNQGVENGTLAMRPDGMFAVSPGNTDTFVLLPPLFFRMTPTYTPVIPANRIVEHDAYRKKLVTSGMLASWAIDVTAMVTIPGGDPKADWGHFNPDAPTVWSDPPPKVTTEPPAAAAPVSAADSGCSSGPRTGLPQMLMLMMVFQLLFWRTRLRRSAFASGRA